MMSESFRAKVVNISAGVAQQKVNLKKFRKLTLDMPSLFEQTEIVRRVDELFVFADQVDQRVKDAQARVNKMTQSILAKAFRGELTSDWRANNPDLITGENSAEALLDRINAERKKTIKKKSRVSRDKGKRMEPEKKRNLLDIIREYPQGISPENLFQKADYETKDVGFFYSDLAKIQDHIHEIRPQAKWPETPILLKVREVKNAH